MVKKGFIIYVINIIMSENNVSLIILKSTTTCMILLLQVNERLVTGMVCVDYFPIQLVPICFE